MTEVRRSRSWPPSISATRQHGALEACWKTEACECDRRSFLPPRHRRRHLRLRRSSEFYLPRPRGHRHGPGFLTSFWSFCGQAKATSPPAKTKTRSRALAVTPTNLTLPSQPSMCVCSVPSDASLLEQPRLRVEPNGHHPLQRARGFGFVVGGSCGVCIRSLTALRQATRTPSTSAAQMPILAAAASSGAAAMVAVAAVSHRLEHGPRCICHATLHGQFR
jgi:hypothetical protein